MATHGITHLSLRNFRSFRKSQNVPLRRLTFVVGPNSSGKTSLAHSLFLLEQSGLLNLRHLGIAWSGPLADLGSFDDCAFAHDRNAKICIKLGISTGKSGRPWQPPSPKSKAKLHDFTVEYQIQTKDDPAGMVARVTMVDLTSGTSLVIGRRRGRYPSYSLKVDEQEIIWKPNDAVSPYFWENSLHSATKKVLDKAKQSKNGNKAAASRLEVLSHQMFFGSLVPGIQRVSSARFAPNRMYERRALVDPEFFRSDPEPLIASITPEMLERPYRHGGKRGPNDWRKLFSQLNELGIADEVSVRDMSAYHRAVYLRDNVTGIDANILDCGYGASQVLPVLWALGSEWTGPLVLEQPEVHLHPRAQGSVGDFIVEGAAHRPIIVETHSEHIINRARIAVAEQRIRASDVMVLYVERTSQGSEVTPIKLDKNGDFERPWPHGFFDERFQDTMKLAELRS